MKVLCALLAFAVSVAFGSKCNIRAPEHELENCLLQQLLTLRIPEPINVNYYYSYIENTNVHLYDIKVFGGSSLGIEHFRLNISDNSYTLKVIVHVPHISVTADYKLKRNIFIFNPSEQGHFTGDLYGIRAELSVDLIPTTQYGRLYLQPEHITPNLMVDDAFITFDGNILGTFAESVFRNKKRSIINKSINDMIPHAKKYIRTLLTGPADEVLSQ